jgi:hypothetical protein
MFRDTKEFESLAIYRGQKRKVEVANADCGLGLVGILHSKNDSGGFVRNFDPEEESLANC